MNVDHAAVIRRHFADFYPELGPATVLDVSRVLLRKKLGRFTNRTVVALYEVRYQDVAGKIGCKAVFVKTKKTLSEHEYPRMKRVWEATSSSGKRCLLPRPLFATDNCLFTEYLPYPSLLHFFATRMLRGTWRLHSRQMAEKVSQVCRWQIDYQSLETYGWEPLSPYIDTAQSAVEQSARFPQAAKKRIIVCTTGGHWRQLSVPKIDSHADFLLRNMAYNGDRIYVADWESVPYRGNLFLDTNCFIFNLLSFSRLPVYSRTAARYLGEVYLREYFANTPLPVDRELYEFTRLLFQIQYLHDYDQGIHKWTARKSRLNDAYMHYIQTNLLMEVSNNWGVSAK